MLPFDASKVGIYSQLIMRWILMGVALLCFAASALAQAKGEVESIGFQGVYRPDCWTPMVVSLRPEIPENATYLLQVHQLDMDGDPVVYQRTITLTGQSASGADRQQRFWMYFLPQSRQTNFGIGLPSSADGGLKALQSVLKVTLSTPSGKFVSALPLTAPADSVEPVKTVGQNIRGSKLVLTVADRNAGFEKPQTADYAKALGLNENVQFVHIDPDQLPDDPIALQAVDAIVFLQVKPNSLKFPTDDSLNALRSYVKGGGRLVICQITPWETMLEWGDLLPVRYPRYGEGEGAIQGIHDRTDGEPLATLAKNYYLLGAPWSKVKLANVGVAEALPGSLVTTWVDWSKTDQPLPARTPFIVRRPMGLGSVTWVAVDLGNTQVASIISGWASIWDTVIDWPNQSYVPDPRLSANQNQRKEDEYHEALGGHLGALLYPGLEHGATGAKLISLVIIFFIIFWLAAGPGIYLGLKTNKKLKYTWLAFALCSLGGVIITVGIVQLALRGDPSIHHVTVVRNAPGQDDRVSSMIGLYIPQDGMMKLSMPGTPSATSVSSIAPLAIHPQLAISNKQGQFINKLAYSVNVRTLKSADPPELSVPFRTTLKKIQAQWAGQLPQSSGITGSVRLPANGDVLDLDAILTNGTSYKLFDVYLCFTNSVGQDILMYLPEWDANKTLYLPQEISWKRLRTEYVAPQNQGYSLPGYKLPIRDYLQIGGSDNAGWVAYWYGSLRSKTGPQWNGDLGSFSSFYPMLSLYDRLPPMIGVDKDTNNFSGMKQPPARVELLRMGGRQMDLSAAVSAGSLVIIGQAQGPLPEPFTVNDAPVESSGTIYWQSVIPIDRTPPAPAASQPAVKPPSTSTTMPSPSPVPLEPANGT